MKVREVGKFIREQRQTARLSLRKLSNMAGVSNPYLSQIERGLRRPSAEILQAIAKALRISAETLYVKAGMLEDRGENLDLSGQILRDTTITEKQKQVLIQVYQSFRSEAAGSDGARRRPASKEAKEPKRRTAAPKGAGGRGTAAKRASAPPSNGRSR